MKNWKYVKTTNSLPHDYHNRYPTDPIYADMKSSATLERIKKEPWKVYDIMGVGDSLARERVFEMIEEKYGIDYNDIYEAWLGHSWDKAVQKKSMDKAKKLAEKLGLRIGNDSTADKLGLKPVLSEIDKKVIEIYKETGKDKEKTKQEIIKRYHFPESQAKKLVDKYTFNESIDKQEWSMFKGLKKDAEKEIGNGTPGSIASIGPAWSHGGTVYGKMDTDDSGKRHTKYVKITWLGDGKGGVANYFIDDKMQSDKLGSLDKNELKKWAETKIGNASESQDIRNEYNAEIYRLEKKIADLQRMGQGRKAMELEKQVAQLQKELRELGNKKIGNDLPMDAEVKYNGYIIRYYPYQGKYIVTHPKDFSKTNAFIGKKFSTSEEAIKAIEKRGVGNEETKAEKKFGKVMGEFKDGELKTPQGKTVTDPEQAKAIAYSESKNVNNLQRARNAIKK